MEIVTATGDDITLDDVTVSGNTDYRLGGNVLAEDVETVSDDAADPSPPIPEPPEDGSIPGEDVEEAE